MTDYSKMEALCNEIGERLRNKLFAVDMSFYDIEKYIFNYCKSNQIEIKKGEVNEC